MSKTLSWPVFVRRVARADRLLVVLDFDGTLAPLVRVPDTAKMTARMRTLLLRLKKRPCLHVAVISGRSLADIKKRVGVSNITYGGSHGMEMRGPGFTFDHPGAFLLKPVLKKLDEDCRRVVASIPGVRVESKRLGVAVHYREVDLKFVPRLMKILERLRSEAHDLPVRWRPGHKVLEAIPRVGWDKGEALKLLKDHLKNPFPIVIGDDRTDEDMFRAVGAKGISVRVAPVGRTKAHYVLQTQEDVFHVLERLDFLVKGKAHA